jgi:hypothetical protein
MVRQGSLFLFSRSEAVEVLKDVLETANIICPDAFIVDRTKDSNFRVRIKTNERDRPTLKEIAEGLGFMVNVEKDTVVIH